MSNGYLVACGADLAAAGELADGFGLDIIAVHTVGDREAVGAALAAAPNVGIVISVSSSRDDQFIALLQVLAARLKNVQLILIEPDALRSFAFLPALWPAMTLDDVRARMPAPPPKPQEDQPAQVEEPAPAPIQQEAAPPEEPAPQPAQNDEAELAADDIPAAPPELEAQPREEAVAVEPLPPLEQAPPPLEEAFASEAAPTVEESPPPEPAAEEALAAEPAAEEALEAEAAKEAAEIEPASGEDFAAPEPQEPTPPQPAAEPALDATQTGGGDHDAAAAPAPARKPGPSRAGLIIPDPSAAPPSMAPADASAFAPKKLRRGEAELVRIAIHQPKDLKAVIKAAKQADPRTDAAAQSMPLGKLILGVTVGIALEVKGGECGGELQRRVWEGDPLDFSFAVTPLPDVKQVVILGRVFVDDAQIGVLAFKREVIGPKPKPLADGERTKLKRHKRVFLSYSSKDRETVSRIATAYQAAGVEHFWDRTSLKSGEEWSPRLRREIERCDLFHLCWSKWAAKSQWVKRETLHALERKKRKASPDITVQMLDGPPWAPHPPELDAINFDDFVRAAIVGYARGEAET